MADLFGIGTILGGLGSLFGSQGPSAKKQSYGSVKGAIQAGAEYGLHPLASIGGATGYSPSGQTNPLEGIGEALQKLGARNENKALAAKEKELIDAQIAESRSRTLMNVGNARRGLIGSQGALGITGSVVPALDSAPGGGKRGVRIEPEPQLGASQRVTLGSLDAIGPNPEAFEVGLSELIAGLGIYGPQWLYKLYRQGQKKIVKPGPTPDVPDYFAP